jgi:hypothetical protein
MSHGGLAESRLTVLESIQRLASAIQSVWIEHSSLWIAIQRDWIEPIRLSSEIQSLWIIDPEACGAIQRLLIAIQSLWIAIQTHWRDLESAVERIVTHFDALRS